MIIYVDYKIIEVDKNRIEKLNKLYEEGNEIHVWIEDTTLFLSPILEKLEKWGCKFNYVKLGKPNYDLIIDEKSEKTSRFFKEK